MAEGNLVLSADPSLDGRYLSRLTGPGISHSKQCQTVTSLVPDCDDLIIEASAASTSGDWTAGDDYIIATSPTVHR